MPEGYAANDADWTRPFEVCPDDEPRQMRELVRWATRAPNAHNTQAWQFQPGPGEMRLFPDFDRRMPHGDPGDRELYLSLGCALENLCLSARRVGWEPTVEHFPDDVDEPCVRVTFADAEPVMDDHLFEAIPMRQSNRDSYDGEPIPAEVLEAIAEAGRAEGIEGIVLTGSEAFERIIDVTDGGFRWQAGSSDFRAELADWIRFSKSANVRRRDGISVRAVGRPHFPEPFGRVLMTVMSKTGLEAREIAGKVRSSSALLALVTDDNDRTTWVRAGRSLIRMKLEAVSRGVVNAHLNNNWQWDATLEPAREALGIGERWPQVVIRLGHAARLPYSTRRPVEDVMRPPLGAGAA